MQAFWTLLGVVVGVAGKYIVDLLLAKKNKLREEKPKWSVEFLAAASRLAQAVASNSDWQLELPGAKRCAAFDAGRDGLGDGLLESVRCRAWRR